MSQLAVASYSDPRPRYLIYAHIDPGEEAARPLKAITYGTWLTYCSLRSYIICTYLRRPGRGQRERGSLCSFCAAEPISGCGAGGSSESAGSGIRYKSPEKGREEKHRSRGGRSRWRTRSAWACLRQGRCRAAASALRRRGAYRLQEGARGREDWIGRGLGADDGPLLNALDRTILVVAVLLSAEGCFQTQTKVVLSSFCVLFRRLYLTASCYYVVCVCLFGRRGNKRLLTHTQKTP